MQSLLPGAKAPAPEPLGFCPKASRELGEYMARRRAEKARKQKREEVVAAAGGELPFLFQKASEAKAKKARTEAFDPFAPDPGPFAPLP